MHWKKTCTEEKVVVVLKGEAAAAAPKKQAKKFAVAISRLSITQIDRRWWWWWQAYYPKVFFIHSNQIDIRLIFPFQDTGTLCVCVSS